MGGGLSVNSFLQRVVVGAFVAPVPKCAKNAPLLLLYLAANPDAGREDAFVAGAGEIGRRGRRGRVDRLRRFLFMCVSRVGKRREGRFQIR